MPRIARLPLWVMIAAGLPLATVESSARANTPKLAGQARFDLFASAGVGSLTNGHVVQGSGSMDRQTWLVATDQPRSYTANL